jgi:hypothetical protein
MTIEKFMLAIAATPQQPVLHQEASYRHKTV